jgi:hypothetical protein
VDFSCETGGIHLASRVPCLPLHQQIKHNPRKVGGFAGVGQQLHHLVLVGITAAQDGVVNGLGEVPQQGLLG